jgi:hypothetical protein
MQPNSMSHEQGRIVPDPDAEVRGAVAMVFRLFHETGSAYAVVHRFTERGLRFPKRAYGGAWDGNIIWGRLSHSRVLGVLKNPSVIRSRRISPGMPHWITLSNQDEQRLREWVRRSRGIQPVS